jgi:hypothetical protein
LSYQQDDWVDYLPLAEFAYNNAFHDGTHTSPFYANYGFHPSFSPSFSRTQSVPAADDLADRLSFIRSELAAELRHAQLTAKAKYDANRAEPPSFEPGDLVMLLRRNLKTTRPTEKLNFRKLGPFKILKKLSSNAYKLNLPASMSRLHPVFNINLLEPYVSPSNYPGRPNPESIPPAILEEGSTLGLPISNFIDVRHIGRRFDYLVKFEGLPSSEQAYIPLSDIPSSYNEALECFHRRNPRLHRPADSTLLRVRTNTPISTPHPPVLNPKPVDQLPAPSESDPTTKLPSLLSSDYTTSTSAIPRPRP